MYADKPELSVVLEHYGVEVPGRSGWAAIRCPIHDDQHKSAQCNLDEQKWNCFTCSTGGDVYTLIMAREGLGYRDAVRFGETNFDGSVRKVYNKQDAGLLGLPRGKRNTGRSGGFFQPWHLQ